MVSQLVRTRRTTHEEIAAFIGIILNMGLVKALTVTGIFIMFLLVHHFSINIFLAINFGFF